MSKRNLSLAKLSCLSTVVEEQIFFNNIYVVTASFTGKIDAKRNLFPVFL